MIRMLLGIVFRISEMMTFENASTAVTEIPITNAGSSFAVTARAEQIPRIWTITGLLGDRGLNNIALFFLLNIMSNC